MSVRLTRLGGHISDETIAPTPGIDCLYEVGGTAAVLLVGHGAMIDSATNTSGRKVITATAALEHLLLGVYQGEGGTGAEHTTSGTPGGNNAATGDAVWLRTYGPGKIHYDTGGSDTFGEFGETMTVGATDGEFVDNSPTESTVGLIPSVVLLEASLADDTLYWAFMRCM